MPGAEGSVAGSNLGARGTKGGGRERPGCRGWRVSGREQPRCWGRRAEWQGETWVPGVEGGMSGSDLGARGRAGGRERPGQEAGGAATSQTGSAPAQTVLPAPPVLGSAPIPGAGTSRGHPAPSPATIPSRPPQGPWQMNGRRWDLLHQRFNKDLLKSTHPLKFIGSSRFVSGWVPGCASSE